MHATQNTSGGTHYTRLEEKRREGPRKRKNQVLLPPFATTKPVIMQSYQTPNALVLSSVRAPLKRESEKVIRQTTRRKLDLEEEENELPRVETPVQQRGRISCPQAPMARSFRRPLEEEEILRSECRRRLDFDSMEI